MTRIIPNLARAAVAAIAVSLITVTAARADGIRISDAWFRALPANVPSAGYFTLSNETGRRLLLTGATSPGCGMLMLHKTEEMSGMATMSDVDSIPIAVGAQLKFAPGGFHLMCMDATAAIHPGNSVPVTLVFADGTKVTAPFRVRSATGH